ncbi:RNA methyltransferase [Mycobacteroides abscessus]|nr:RNA methyltransferase [Mycobacteroides abscessus]
MTIGDILEVQTGGAANGGSVVARHDGRVIFVRGALPGERVRVQITDDRQASFWHGAAVEVLDPSPHRIDHCVRSLTAPWDRAAATCLSLIRCTCASSRAMW